jgi:hypothetical protein
MVLRVHVLYGCVFVRGVGFIGVVAKCLVGERDVVSVRSNVCQSYGLARHRGFRVVGRRVVVVWVVCHVGCCGMSVQGDRLGMMVSFVGVEGSFMFGDATVAGREESVRHVMSIQSCIFEGMCNDGQSHGKYGVQGRIIEAYVGGFA